MELEEVLRKVREGAVSVEEAARLVRLYAIASVGTNLKLDVSREERTGIPEVVLGEGKRPQDIVEAARTLFEARGLAIVTRCPPDVDLSSVAPFVERHRCGVVVLRDKNEPLVTGGVVALLTAGASDIQVAEEAGVVAQALGCRVVEERDVGVASLARAVAAVQRLLVQGPHVWIVAAGREAALAPVVGGMVPGPVIGVPVSTGYGYRGKGEAALSTMLQSCTPVLTVNIDAGFVAGAAAAQIANRVAAASKALK
jgi:pyridinium-3,5-biscarboxylic acid mononucleotide synthase